MSSVSRSVGRPVSRSVLAGQSTNLTQLIKALFANQEQGFAYDPNDLTTLYQDAAGTIPVTSAGQTVGLMRDKSGRGNHAFQTISASRPILQRNATTGAYYLVFDGVDDFLQTNNIDFTVTDKVSLFAGVRKLRSDRAYEYIIANYDDFSAQGLVRLRLSSTNTKAAFEFKNNTYRSLSTSEGIADNTPLLFSAQRNATGATFKVAGQSLQISDVKTSNFTETPMYIGCQPSGVWPAYMHLYSLIIIGRLTTDTETLALEKAIAKNTGVTLNV